MLDFLIRKFPEILQKAKITKSQEAKVKRAWEESQPSLCITYIYSVKKPNETACVKIFVMRPRWKKESGRGPGPVHRSLPQNGRFDNEALFR